MKEGNADALSLLADAPCLPVEGGPHGPARYLPRSSVPADPAPERRGPLRAIVFPEYARGARVQADPLPPADLVRSVLGSFSGDCAAAEAFARLARMADDNATLLLRLRFGDAREAAGALAACLLEGGGLSWNALLRTA